MLRDIYIFTVGFPYNTVLFITTLPKHCRVNVWGGSKHTNTPPYPPITDRLWVYLAYFGKIDGVITALLVGCISTTSNMTSFLVCPFFMILLFTRITNSKPVHERFPCNWHLGQRSVSPTYFSYTGSQDSNRWQYATGLLSRQPSFKSVSW